MRRDARQPLQTSDVVGMQMADINLRDVSGGEALLIEASAGIGTSITPSWMTLAPPVPTDWPRRNPEERLAPATFSEWEAAYIRPRKY